MQDSPENESQRYHQGVKLKGKFNKSTINKKNVTTSNFKNPRK